MRSAVCSSAFVRVMILYSQSQVGTVLKDGSSELSLEIHTDTLISQYSSTKQLEVTI